MADRIPPLVSLDPFAFRQFDNPDYSGTVFRDISKEDFAKKVQAMVAESEPALVDGYAPFCKHLFLPNFTLATVPVLPISDANEALLRSGYTARRPEELPVLERWFPAEAVPEAPRAAYLDLILYSRDQINKESAAMPAAAPELAGEATQWATTAAPWGIISIKAQDTATETPMNPITMMRNALGKDQGGSGVPLDPVKYTESVKYWSTHAAIKG